MSTGCCSGRIGAWTRSPSPTPARGQVSRRTWRSPPSPGCSSPTPSCRRRRGGRGPLLHLKGPALPARAARARQAEHRRRRAGAARASSPLEGALHEHGWEQVSHVRSGSAFEHAANWWHPHWGYADLHARWPGATVSPEDTFAALGEDAFLQPIAHVPVSGARAAPPRSWSCSCTPPGRPATRRRRARLARAEPDEQRAAVVDLADRLGATGRARRRARRPRGRTATTRATPCGASTARVAAGSTSGGRATGRPPPRAARRRVVVSRRPGQPRPPAASSWAAPPTRADVRTAQLGRIGTLGRESARRRGRTSEAPAP